MTVVQLVTKYPEFSGTQMANTLLTGQEIPSLACWIQSKHLRHIRLGFVSLIITNSVLDHCLFPLGFPE